MDSKLKEVYFDEYCQTCKYAATPEEEDPCDECLGNPGNYDSHKPVKWEAKQNADSIYSRRAKS